MIFDCKIPKGVKCISEIKEMVAQGLFDFDKVVEKSKPKRGCIICYKRIKVNQNIEENIHQKKTKKYLINLFKADPK
ncbi:putative conjugative transfer protein [Orientia chuto str. Dubai]|uniref:Putative conjugative transfer protein n=1 Tax=Orientia chuto str. Dubai TaxID=1359168 RepID=A0A0F3MIS9_9RICK|nr:putative conjugative transfer protein [Orientia chuto str. Dubai]